METFNKILERRRVAIAFYGFGTAIIIRWIIALTYGTDNTAHYIVQLIVSVGVIIFIILALIEYLKLRKQQPHHAKIKK